MALIIHHQQGLLFKIAAPPAHTEQIRTDLLEKSVSSASSASLSINYFKRSFGLWKYPAVVNTANDENGEVKYNEITFVGWHVAESHKSS
ncbi:MAG: hypothetical protein KDE51_18905 [Anaerolineales bacterium]|nr:hypothetical protein [Anaerolineales bacterium]